MTRRPGLLIRLVRHLIATIEMILRWLVVNHHLPETRTRKIDVRYGEDPKHRLDIIVPWGGGPLPLLVYVHGGGWVAGDKRNFLGFTSALATAGAVVFSINYRWVPEVGFAEQVRDVVQALEFPQGGKTSRHRYQSHAGELATRRGSSPNPWSHPCHRKRSS